MRNLSQRDPRWRGKRLGKTSVTIGSHGCTITCIAMILNMLPDQVNDILTEGGGYTAQGHVIWVRAGQLLGFTWVGVEGIADAKKFPIIVETRGFGGFLQHFQVYVGTTRVGNREVRKVVDPWDLNPSPRNSNLGLLSTRTIRINTVIMDRVAICRRIWDIYNMVFGTRPNAKHVFDEASLALKRQRDGIDWEAILLNAYTVNPHMYTHNVFRPDIYAKKHDDVLQNIYKTNPSLKGQDPMNHNVRDHLYNHFYNDGIREKRTD